MAATLLFAVTNQTGLKVSFHYSNVVFNHVLIELMSLVILASSSRFVAME